MLPQRLSNLSQTDVAPLLPLPVVYEPISASPANDLSSLEISYEPAVAQHVLALLQSCDTSYIISKQAGASAPNVTAPVSKLHQAIRKLDPGAFETHMAGRPRLPVEALAAGETVSSNHPTPATLCLNAATSDSISQSTVSPVEQRKPKRTRSVVETKPESSEADLVAGFNESMQSILAKQQSHQDNSQEDGPQETDSDVDIDGMKESMPKTGIPDIRALNNRLTKLALANSIRLVQSDQLLLLLDALDSTIQQGDSLLVGTCAQDNVQQQAQILLSVEACMACLQILAAPGMPKQVYKEELIDRLVGLVRFHLLHNVLVFYDAAFCQAQRPELLNPDEDDFDGQEAQPGSKKKTPKSARKSVPKLRVPASAKAIQSGLEVVLQLMGQLMTAVLLQHSTLLTLSRVACQILIVEGVDLLQIKAAGLLIAIFQHCPPLQNTLMEDVLTQVLPRVPVGKRCPRAYLVGDEKSASIQVIVAMLVQMVQACVHLPVSSGQDDSSGVADLRDCFAPAVAHSDIFWHGCFDRFPSAKAQKSDSDQDVKQLVEQIILDLLRVQNLPAWPAAGTVLIRCINALGGPKGLQHPDASVRQISVDLLGLIAAHLYKDALTAEDNQAWLTQFAASDGEDAGSEAHMVAQHLLLDFLADRHQQKDTALSLSARTFLTCRLFADELTSLRAAAALTQQQQAQLLVKYHNTSEQLEKGLVCDLNAGEAARLSAALMQQGPLGTGRKGLLTWLIGAADNTKQVATTRAKAVKALGSVAETDPRLLASLAVQKGVNKALQDDAVSVREAAVDLLGKHISSSRDLALVYFDVLATAVRDPGTSVRKRAVNIMRESCIKQPGFPRATQACVHILTRATDPEESIQKLVTKVFHNLWFSPVGPGEGLSPQSRAQQLAEVAVAVYEAGCSAIHLPLESSNPLLTILKQALEKEGAEQSVGQALATALLESVLQAVDTEADSFPPLIALHAFCLADVSLCMPPNDPASFARCLAPYLKDLEIDLVQLINGHHYVQVVSGAAHALCCLARLSPSAGQRLAALMTLYLGALKQKHPLLLNPPAEPAARQTNDAHISRFLFIVGQLVRHGADILQHTATSGPPTLDICQLLDTLLSFYNLLQALQLSAPTALKLKVLSNLLELLKSEEEGLKVKQEETGEAVQLPDQAGRATAEAATSLVVPVQNGEGDSLNLSAGFIQNNWEAVKALALDTSRSQQQLPTSPSQDAQSSAQVRRRALEVMEAVLRGGVMPPFSAVPTLFALTTDPTRDVSERALRVLRKEADKYSEVRSRLASAEGLHAAALFQEGLKQATLPGQSPVQGFSNEASRGMAAVYLHLLQPDRSLRWPFMRTLIRCFDSASDLLTRGAAPADPRLLSFCANVAACLPFKKCDEAHSLLHLINATISRRGDFVLSAQKSSLESATDPGPISRQDPHAVPDAVNGVQQSDGLNVQIQADGTSAVLASDAEGQPSAKVHGEPGSARKQRDSKAGRAACMASLALTMLLMLKRYLKATYNMSEERIAAFSPDIPEKRKQEERISVTVQEGAELPLHCLRLDAPQQPDLWKEQYKVFKFYMKSDASDYGEGVTLMRTTSRKRAHRTDSMQEAAELANDGADDGAGFEGRSTDGTTPFLPEGVSPVIKSKAGKGQRSTAARSARGGSSKARASTRTKPRPRKRHKVVEYADADDIDGDVDFGDMYENDADDDFKAPGTSAAARKRLEPML
ncbi:hypothetical protein WJX79_009424 [Trebouxia sp. C0005]